MFFFVINPRWKWSLGTEKQMPTVLEQKGTCDPHKLTGLEQKRLLVVVGEKPPRSMVESLSLDGATDDHCV